MFQSGVTVDTYFHLSINRKAVAVNKKKEKGIHDACKGELRKTSKTDGYYGKWWMFEMIAELPRKQKMSLLYFLVSLTFCLVQSIRLILRLTQ